MKRSWKNTVLKKILQPREIKVELKPTEKYRLLGMSLEGRGLFIREEKAGIEIGAKTLNKVVSGDFIYSRLFAWKGAFDYVKPDFEDCYASGEFPTFEIDRKKVDIKYLTYYFHQARVWKEVEQYCIGVTKASRNRFKEKFFLDLKIPLPPLEEQQQIVTKLEKAREYSEKIRELRSKQEQDINNLLYSEYLKIIKDVPWKKMQVIAPITRRPVEIKPDGEYPELGIRSFGKGTFHKPTLTGIEVGTKKIYQIKAGDLMFSNVFAWEGAIAVAKEVDNDRVGSHRFISCVLDLETVQPHFLSYHFLSPRGMEDINRASPGGAGRNKTLGLKKLENIEVPLPSIEKQHEFEALQRQLKQLKEHNKETLQNLDDLFPALLDKAFKGELVSSSKTQTLQPVQSEPEERHFPKRKILATHIINQSVNDSQFGDTKFEKLLHLTEYHAIKRNFNQHYIQKAAGLYDNKFTYPFFQQVIKGKWFYKEKKGDLNLIKPGANHDKSKANYGYFSTEELDKVNSLISHFKKYNYEQPEIVSTLYAVWNNRIIRQQDTSDELLIEDFYKWDKQKAKYAREQLEKALDWMRNEGIIPDGWGKVIEKAKGK